MEFSADRQTLDDLNLLGQYKANSIINLFNHTVSQSGNALIDRMFRRPLTEADAINNRERLFEAFAAHSFEFPLSAQQTDTLEQYFAEVACRNRMAEYLQLSIRYGALLIARDMRYEECAESTVSVIEILKTTATFLAELQAKVPDSPLSPAIKKALTALQHPAMQRLFEEPHNSFGFLKLGAVHYLLTATLAEEMRALIELLAQIDVVISVADVARDYGFCFPTALTDSESCIEIQQLYHPRVRGAVANDICLRADHNVFFLTGANMAGKSTLMKSFGVAVYLAHMGFPVAAQAMRFTVQEGIYSSINLPDNITLGYSHFYAEVQRVKQIAGQVASGKRLVVIFDELFKGTNVKDAYDATVSLVEAFSQMSRCNFIISTHIMEAGVWLRDQCPNMTFQYLPTVMEGNVPRYTYHLTDGITDDRHGMKIILNEGILEIIAQGSKPTAKA